MENEAKILEIAINTAVDAAETKADVKSLDKRINGAMGKIATHIDHGKKWRVTIAVIGVGVVLNVIAFAYVFGRLAEAVEGNTAKIKDHKLDHKDYALQKPIIVKEGQLWHLQAPNQNLE